MVTEVRTLALLSIVLGYAASVFRMAYVGGPSLEEVVLKKLNMCFVCEMFTLKGLFPKTNRNVYVI